MRGSGDTLGRYKLQKRLAGGGMGEVFLATTSSSGLGSRVALKVLRSELASDSSFVQMMIDEARISMFLNHQNIVSVLDFAQEGDDYYLAMEFVQGTTVEHLLEALKNRQRPPDLAIALYVASEMCRALKYAHACVDHKGQALNIIHRDVTPANVLLSIHGEVKLTDFGIARAIGRVHETQAGMVKGKFGYLAPEITRNEQIDSRADLFSLGVLVYHLATGQHPIPNASIMEAIFRFEEQAFPPPSEINPDVPKAIDPIIMRALEPQPNDRYSSAQDFGTAIQEAVMASSALRRVVQHGAEALTSMLREVLPEVFEDPLRMVEDSATSRLEEDTLRPDRSFNFPTKPVTGPTTDPMRQSTIEDMPSIQHVRFLESSTSPEAMFALNEPTRSEDMFGAKTEAHDRGLGLQIPSVSGFGDKTTTDAPHLEPPRAAAESPFEAPASYEDLPIVDRAEWQLDAPTTTGDGFDEATRVDKSFMLREDLSRTEEQEPLSSGDVGFGAEGTEIMMPPLSRKLPSGAASPADRTPPPVMPTSRSSEEEMGDEPTRLRKSEDDVPETILRGTPVLPGLAEKPGSKEHDDGKPSFDELSWSDEAAARRAVETRNDPRDSGAQNQLVRSSSPRGRVAQSSAERVPMTSLPPIAGPTPHSVRPTFEPKEEAARAARSRTTLFACVLIAISVGTIAGVVTYPRILKPTLRIATSPAGARVLINGSSLPKRTPVAVDVAPHQKQHVEIELFGFEREARDVSGLDRGQTYQLTIELQAASTASTGRHR